MSFSILAFAKLFWMRSNLPSNLNYESIIVSLPSTEQVHLTRFYKDKNKLLSPVFLLHSIFQDSTTFFTHEGHGLACFLARQGYDVFVADLRGKGKSWPQVNSRSDFGAHQSINEDIPALLHEVISRRGHVPQIWIGHGWGGVLLCSVFAKYGSAFCPVSHMVHFGVRRKVIASQGVNSFYIHKLQQPLHRMLAKVVGYIPSRLVGLGGANESVASYFDYLLWSQADLWVDPKDDFDYGTAALRQDWPVSLYFAAEGDTIAGNVRDVRVFIESLGAHDGRLMLLGHKLGNLNNYKHLTMINSPDADQDHFQDLLNWLQ
jgi:pimeloyl-ACP methyl ester carboxylesterase